MTTSVAILQRLHEHRAWVNGNLLAAVADVSEEQLHRSFAIGQGSLWKSLTHMFAAEFVWLATLEGNESPLAPGDLPGHLPGNQLAENKIASLTELRQKWSDLEARWQRYLQDLPADSLDDLVYKLTYTGQRLATRRSDILLHVAMHAHYTAAQTINMLRQSGVTKMPESMVISLARQQTAAGT